MIGLSKEQQLAHHNRRKAAKQSSKAKGNELEDTVAKAFNGRRNNQAKAGGGISNSDVSAMRGWMFEVKNTERLEIPKWTDNLLAETPAGHHCGFVYNHKGRLWLAFPLEWRVNFAQDLIEHMGGSITFHE